MTTADEFSDFLAAVCPFGATVEPCREDGTRLRAPGSFSIRSAVVAVAPAEQDALVRIRFAPPPPATPTGTTFSTYTTDPWVQLPDEPAWVAPDLDADGRQLGWLRITPNTEALA